MAIPRFIQDTAQALVSAAIDEGVVPEIVTDLKAIIETQEQHPDVFRTLSERSISTEARADALKTALNKQVHPFVLNTLQSLLHQNALVELPHILTAVLTEARSRADHHDINMTSAIPLTDSERKRLHDMLKKKFGGTQTFSEHIEPSIIGGLILDSADWHVDASIQGKLRRLTNALTA